MLIFSFCDLDMPLFLLLWWLIPFILGWLLGQYWGDDEESQTTDVDSIQNYIDNNNELTLQLKTLQSDLYKCRENNIELQQNINKLQDKLNTSLDNDKLILKAQAPSKEANVEKSKEPLKIVPVAKTSPKVKNKTTDKYSIYGQLEPNNLQVVEGIGPKMNEILHSNNIKNWSDLASSTKSSIRQILDKYGMKYRMIDPKTWPKQASMAEKGKWKKLISFQKSLSGGVNKTIIKPTDAKVEKLLIKLGLLRKFKQDDLKAIEGIGPKIASLLIAAGINSWETLSKSSLLELNNILEDAGKRYALANPETWPEQAKLAANQEWDELQLLQNELKGGRRRD